jgi:ribulose-5-phosphate 4-epimerase/fuculose-1-phosphate aldolase
MNLLETARQFHTSGLNTSGQGVLAARLGERDLISITSSKSDFESVQRDDIYQVNLAGEVVQGASSAELPAELDFYLKVFQDRPDTLVLAHLYPPYVSVFADKSQLFKLSENPGHSRVRELIKVECRECPSRFTGLCSCRPDIRKSYAGADALLIKEDGIIVLAADFDSLFNKVETIEDSAKKSYFSNSL